MPERISLKYLRSEELFKWYERKGTKISERKPKRRDGVVKGVVLLRKGNSIQWQLQLVCPLELQTCRKELAKMNQKGSNEGEKNVNLLNLNLT